MSWSSIYDHLLARSGPWRCPQCGVHFFASEIPLAIRENYSPPHWYARRIGVYSLEADRTVAWRCHSCGHVWDRE